MFGYATDETEECMPLTVVLAHNLNKQLSDLRRDGTLWWARPDTKTQVNIFKEILFYMFLFSNASFFLLTSRLLVSTPSITEHANP